jgi:hypothetical protein
VTREGNHTQARKKIQRAERKTAVKFSAQKYKEGSFGLLHDKATSPQSGDSVLLHDWRWPVLARKMKRAQERFRLRIVRDGDEAASALRSCETVAAIGAAHSAIPIGST